MKGWTGFTKKSKEKLMIAHGKVTHEFGKKCKICQRINKEFEEDKERNWYPENKIEYP